MLSQLDPYLPWLLPPLLGALIGYVTNYIAIRMLFRPLHPWRIAGIRVPLTPGIIPSKRDQLARKMGEMVGDHLLTSDDVGRALDKTGFRKQLHGAVTDKLDQFINQPLAAPISLLPQQFHQRFGDLLETLRWKALRALGRHLDSDAFEQQLTGFCSRYLEHLLQRNLASLLKDPRHSLCHHLDRRLSQWLESERLEPLIQQFLDHQRQQLLSSERCVADLLPAELVDSLLALLEQELPGVLEQLADWLEDPQVRAQLEQKARDGIGGFIDSIDGLSALIGALFDMEKIYARLPGFLDSASVELKQWLQTSATQQQIAALLRQSLHQWLNRPLLSFIEQMSYEKVVKIQGFIGQRLAELLRRPTTRQLLVDKIGQGIDSIKERPLADLIDPLLPDDGRRQAATLIAGAIIEQLRSQRSQQKLDDLLRDQLDYWIYRRPLGQISRYLPSDGRDELAQGLFDQLTTVMKKEIPPLVDSLDICRIVEDKVNSLDILKVEGLLMGIMKEQFKYINLFGALLGMLIGLLNLLLLRL